MIFEAAGVSFVFDCINLCKNTLLLLLPCSLLTPALALVETVEDIAQRHSVIGKPHWNASYADTTRRQAVHEGRLLRRLVEEIAATGPGSWWKWRCSTSLSWGQLVCGVCYPPIFFTKNNRDRYWRFAKVMFTIAMAAIFVVVPALAAVTVRSFPPFPEGARFIYLVR